MAPRWQRDGRGTEKGISGGTEIERPAISLKGNDAPLGAHAKTRYTILRTPRRAVEIIPTPVIRRLQVYCTVLYYTNTTWAEVQINPQHTAYYVRGTSLRRCIAGGAGRGGRGPSQGKVQYFVRVRVLYIVRKKVKCKGSCSCASDAPLRVLRQLRKAIGGRRRSPPGFQQQLAPRGPEASAWRGGREAGSKMGKMGKNATLGLDSH